METRRYWDMGGLADALATSEPVASGRMSLSFVPGAESLGALQVVLHECGDLIVILAVAGLEMEASVALVPVAEIGDVASFDHKLLKANRLLPLSTFGITEIGGKEYYEIFGQLSAASALQDVIDEIETLGRNALEAAEMIDGWKAGHKAAG